MAPLHSRCDPNTLPPRQVAPEGGAAKLPWTPAAALSMWPADVSCREFTLPAPLAPWAKTALLSVAVYTHVLRPEPAEVAQREAQRVVFRGGARLMSPYAVESQASEVWRAAVWQGVALAGCGLLAASDN